MEGAIGKSGDPSGCRTGIPDGPVAEDGEGGLVVDRTCGDATSDKPRRPGRVGLGTGDDHLFHQQVADLALRLEFDPFHSIHLSNGQPACGDLLEKVWTGVRYTLRNEDADGARRIVLTEPVTNTGDGLLSLRRIFKG